MDQLEASIATVLGQAHASLDALEHVASEHTASLEQRLLTESRRQRGRDIVRRQLNMSVDAIKRRVFDDIRASIDATFPWNEPTTEMDDSHPVREVLVKITDPQLLDNIITSMRTKQQSIVRSELQSWMSALEEHLNHRRIHNTSRNILVIPGVRA
jgi:hypothetical protein